MPNSSAREELDGEEAAARSIDMSAMRFKQILWHCHVNPKESAASLVGSMRRCNPVGVVHVSGGNTARGDFLPEREAVGHLGTPFQCCEPVSAGPEMR